MLAWTLRERSNAAVNPAGVQRAVDLAKARLAADTSNAVPNDVAPVAPVRPAPGGPPVSGDN